MSKHQRTGGPAFPTVKAESPGEAPVGVFVTAGDEPGMSLRDYFAAAALSGLTSRSHQLGEHETNATAMLLRMLPKVAYQYADAMLRARAQATEAR